ncbi:hypothetical protein V2J09_014648 [Rumex salicifolius]
MKASFKDSEKLVAWDQVRGPSTPTSVGLQARVSSSSSSSKLILCLLVFVSSTYLLYTFRLLSNPHDCPTNDEIRDSISSSTQFISAASRLASQSNESVAAEANTVLLMPPPPPEMPPDTPIPPPTNISHLVFGIAASSKLWSKRKEYLKIWFKPESGMRGAVWLDSLVRTSSKDAAVLPPIRISADTSRFAYSHRKGHRSAIRISRIVSETLRLGMKDVRWFVLGDDDTVFITENLVKVLAKYDHNQYYYIGSSSESHLQNIYFSYGMAYGGGGFAISYPLAVALEKMQDRCIQRYPGLYGSDDRMQACMVELGVPLTKELGFHQYDVYGNLFGLLAAHPVAPLVSLHHLDVVEPVFPNVTRVEALKRLVRPMKIDSAGLMQQSICYDKERKWTISVSWGYAVQVIRGILSPREMEMPTRTFLNWYKRGDYIAYSFNTRPVARNPCQKPFVFYLENARVHSGTNRTVSEYMKHQLPQPTCKWKTEDPSVLQKVKVYKAQDPHLWDRSPRRNCCRVMSSKIKGTLEIDVGLCEEDEVTEVANI